jgi:hypothetical protein
MTLLDAFLARNGRRPAPWVAPVRRTAYCRGGECGCASCESKRETYAASTPLKQVNGRLASSRSKTGLAECSQAASDWKTGKGGAETQKILGHCRSVARGQARAHLQRAAGHEARAQHFEHVLKSGGPVTAKGRKAAAREKRAGRAAKAAPKPPGTSAPAPKDRSPGAAAGRIAARVRARQAAAAEHPGDEKARRLAEAARGKDLQASAIAREKAEGKGSYFAKLRAMRERMAGAAKGAETPATAPARPKREIVNEKIEANHRANQEAAKGARVVVLSNGEATGFPTLMAHPSANEKGRYQLSRIDADGEPMGHTTHDTKEEAIASASGVSSAKGEPPVGNSDFKVVRTQPEPAPSAAPKGGPSDVPEGVKQRVRSALGSYRERAEDIRRGADLGRNPAVGGGRRYVDDTRRNAREKAPGREAVRKFLRLARENDVDGPAVVRDLAREALGARKRTDPLAGIREARPDAARARTVIDRIRGRVDAADAARGGPAPAAPPPAVKPKPSPLDRLRLLVNRAGGRARDLDARGKLSEADATRGRRARLKEALDRATGKGEGSAPAFGLKMKAEGAGFANEGKGKTAALFDEMKGAAARDLPGQGNFLGGGNVREYQPGPKSERADLRTAPKGGSGDLSALLGSMNARRQRTAQHLKEQRARLRAASRDPSTHTDHRPGTITPLRTDLIHADPERFQYKLGHASGSGSVGSLAGAKWNPELGGVMQVWKDPGDGKTYIINGHNRLDLAKRAGAPHVNVQFIDAPTAEAAKAKGALKNIAGGRGSSVDAASFFRNSGIGREDLERHGIAMKDRVASEGVALARLHEPIFRRVVEGSLHPEKAAMIGAAGLTPAQQATVVKQIDKGSKSRPITTGHLRELLDNAREAGSATTRGFDLFGPNEEETSLALHRSKVQEAIRDRLSHEKRLFGTVAKSRHAGELARGGNTINAGESGKISQDAANTLDVFDMLKNSSGTQIPHHLNEAARRIHAGENPRQVIEDVYGHVLREARGVLGGGKARVA